MTKRNPNALPAAAALRARGLSTMTKDARHRAAKAAALARWPIPHVGIERCACDESEHLRAALRLLLTNQGLSREDTILIIGRAMALEPLKYGDDHDK